MRPPLDNVTGGLSTAATMQGGKIGPGCPGWSRLVPGKFFLHTKRAAKKNEMNPIGNISSNAALMEHESVSKAVILRGLPFQNDVSLQLYDFSPVANIFHLFSRFFTPFFRCKELVFRRLSDLPGYKRRTGRGVINFNADERGERELKDEISMLNGWTIIQQTEILHRDNHIVHNAFLLLRRVALLDLAALWR